MFKVGQTYKVKLAFSPGSTGFGRAELVCLEAQRIYIRLKLSKPEKVALPPGTRIWFVGTDSENFFNGLWFSEITGEKYIGGQSCYECRLPKFEMQAQKRNKERFEISAPVKLLGDEWRNLRASVEAQNISKLGMGLSVSGKFLDFFPPGKELLVELQGENFSIESRVKIVSSRLNWFYNRTEIGVEYCQKDYAATNTLDRLLSYLAGKKEKSMKSVLSESGSLAKWVKAEKDEFRFVKTQPDDEDTLIDEQSQVDEQCRADEQCHSDELKENNGQDKTENNSVNDSNKAPEKEEEKA